MNIKILGCSGNLVGRHRTTCFLINESLLIDAGTTTDSLRRKRLLELKHVLVTHTHMDHLKGLFPLVDELAMMGGSHHRARQRRPCSRYHQQQLA
jgi:ribonuclease BN (tRNA processing enzyme)